MRERGAGIKLDSARIARSSLTRRDFLKVGGTGLAGAGVLLGVPGCGVFGGSQEGGQGGGGGSSNTLNINLGSDIPDMDPSTSTDAVASILIDNSMEGLYRLDASLEPQPAMAEGVEVSDDQLNYTFTLREGVTWSNGEPVTSQDFRFAWLRAMDPEIASQYGFIIADYIEGGDAYASGEGSAEDVAIATPDERTLEVTLANPAPYFLGLTAFKTYVPMKQSFVEEQGEDFGLSADALLYNGPYLIEEFQPANGATLQKREDYWDAGNVDIQTVNAQVVKDEQAALNLYESGELDRTGLTSEQVEQYRDSPEFSTYTQFITWWLQFNTQDSVMQNENIRKAIQIGIDRQALAGTILNNGSVPAAGLIPDGMEGPGDQTFREAYGDIVPEFNAEEAGRLYQQGVEELGEEPTLTLLTGDTSVARDLATFVQSQFQENIGAQLEIDQQPFDARLDRQREGEFQISQAGWIADYNDPSSFMDLYTTENGFNDIQFSNDRYDELVNGARTEADNDQRMEMFSEAESILIEDEAWLSPLYFEGSAQLIKPYLNNVEIFPFGSEYSLKLWELESE